MKTTRILTLGRDSYALASTVTDAEAMKLLEILSKGIQSYDSEHLAGKRSLYEISVGVVSAEIIDVGLKITAAEFMTREEFRAREEAAAAVYLAANPKPAAT